MWKNYKFISDKKLQIVLKLFILLFFTLILFFSFLIINIFAIVLNTILFSHGFFYNYSTQSDFLHVFYYEFLRAFFPCQYLWICLGIFLELLLILKILSINIDFRSIFKRIIFILLIIIISLPIYFFVSLNRAMENWGDFSNITKDFSSKIYEKNHERVEFGDLEVNIMRFEINNTNLHSDLDKIILNAQKQYGYEISQSCTQADSYSVYVNLTNTKISRKTSDFTLCLLTPYTDIYPAKLTIDVNLKDNQMWEIKTTQSHL